MPRLQPVWGMALKIYPYRRKHIMKKFLEEFKAFALKGNMMDMAIGVLIGGAFSTLVTSLTDNIINPIIGILFQTDFSDVVLHLPFDINLGIGAFISAVINFIILAFVLFCMLKAMNKLMDLGKHEEEKPAEPEAPRPRRRRSC